MSPEAETIAQMRAAFKLSWEQAQRDHDELQAALIRKDQLIASLYEELGQLKAYTCGPSQRRFPDAA